MTMTAAKAHWNVGGVTEGITTVLTHALEWRRSADLS